MRKTKSEWDKFVDAWVYILKDVIDSEDNHNRFKLNRIVSILQEEEDTSMNHYTQHMREIAADNAFRKVQ